jgi:hypothetical protein
MLQTLKVLKDKVGGMEKSLGVEVMNKLRSLRKDVHQVVSPKEQ